MKTEAEIYHAMDLAATFITVKSKQPGYGLLLAVLQWVVELQTDGTQVVEEKLAECERIVVETGMIWDRRLAALRRVEKGESR